MAKRTYTESMVRRLGWLLLAIPGLVWFGACGPNDSGGELDASSFAKRRAELRATVRCRVRVERCEGRPPPQSGQSESVDACERRLTRAWEEGGAGKRELGTDPALLDAVERGAVEFDRESAEKCLGKLESYVDSLSCIQVGRIGHLFADDTLDPYLYPVCEEVWIPKLGKGATCATTASCESGFACVRSDTDADCGTCQTGRGDPREVRNYAFADKGGSCGGPNYDPICNPTRDIVCSRAGENGGSWRCIDARSRGEGDPCGAGACESGFVCRDGTCKPFDVVDEGGECLDDDTYCSTGLICRANSGGTLVCGEPAEAGEPCSTDSHCQDDLWCDGSTDVRSGEVGECRELVAVGESCSRPGVCESSLFCDLNGEFGDGDSACRELRQEGENCAGTSRACADGYSCGYSGSDGEYLCTPNDDSGEGVRSEPTSACKPGDSDG